MNRSTRWAARTVHLLAGHIDRLRETLDLLGERLREAVARAVGQSVAGAAQDAVQSLLAEPQVLPAPFAVPSSSRPSSGFWRDPYDEDAAAWRDDPMNPYHPPANDKVDETPSASSPEQSPEAVGRRWGVALAVGCQAAAWWLRQKTGRFVALTAAGVGLASALAAYIVAPALAAGAGLAGSALTLAALSDAARCGTAALFGTGTR